MFITWTYLRNMKVSFLFMIIFFATSLNALGADNNIHLISTELTRGQLEQKDGKYIGSYAAFFSKASKRSGVQIDYRIVPWTRAVKETERSDNLLLFPFSRTQERENRFTWIAPLKEDPMCFASLGKRINSLDEARKLKRVIVGRGTSHQAFLEGQGFQNLIKVGKKKKIIEILKAANEAAWYFICSRAQTFLDPSKLVISVKIGTQVASETTWLAGGRSFVLNPGINKFVKAIDALKKENFLEKYMAETVK